MDAPGQPGQQIEGGAVGPVQVIEGQETSTFAPQQPGEEIGQGLKETGLAAGTLQWGGRGQIAGVGEQARK